MRSAAVVLAMALGCRAEPTSAVPPGSEPDAAPIEPVAEPTPTARERCIPLVERDGVDTLRSAAQNGHAGAQSLYGRTVFSTRFMAQAPTPEEKEDYVSALAFLRVASKAGEEQAKGFLPGIEGEASAVDEPLDTLPEGWVAEAFARADAWIDCYGLPKVSGSPGAR